ncbi:MAG: class I SAM-dependent methyltransferase [Pseudomonadota bacterium]
MADGPVKGVRKARARQRLLNHFKKGGEGAEIGVHLGEFAVELLSVVGPSRLHLIDPWRRLTGPTHKRALYGSHTSQQEMDARHQAVADRFAREVAAGGVVIHRAFSVEASTAFAPATLDFVYLDGDHSFEGTSADVAAWWPIVKPGGILAADDYRIGGWWGAGVVDALRPLLAKSDAIVAFKDASQIAVQKLEPGL